jgi:ABC-type multidrug transport system ATPase subunit
MNVATELRIENLSKTYANGVRALDGISLTVGKGMFGLLGPNGAGKSTLMRTLATLQDPDGGSVHLGSLDVLRDKSELRKTLGYLPQDFGLYASSTADSLLDYFAMLEGIRARSERRRTVEALLRKTNLWEVRKRKAGGFSGGMRQRFGIAVALLGNPSLLIVDEPTAGLDPAERVRFLNLLSELGEQSVVILSTHLVQDVAELCSRMAIINRGRILLQGEPSQAIAELRGRIWSRFIVRDELRVIEREHRVISTKLVAGRTLVRVHCEAHPGGAFEAAEPDLEDVYFSALSAEGVVTAEVTA